MNVDSIRRSLVEMLGEDDERIRSFDGMVKSVL